MYLLWVSLCCIRLFYSYDFISLRMQDFGFTSQLLPGSFKVVQEVEAGNRRDLRKNIDLLSVPGHCTHGSRNRNIGDGLGVIILTTLYNTKIIQTRYILYTRKVVLKLVSFVYINCQSHLWTCQVLKFRKAGIPGEKPPTSGQYLATVSHGIRFLNPEVQGLGLW